MPLDCGATVVKYVLCLFNFALFVSISWKRDWSARFKTKKNLLLQWGGAAVLGIGIWLAADQSSFLTLIKFTQAENVQVKIHIFIASWTDAHLSSDTRMYIFVAQNLVQPAVITQSAYLLIAAGAFIFIVSFLGYCGAVKESRVLLGLVGI